MYSKKAFSPRFFGEAEAISALPERKSDSNKGSFGRALIISGSEKYIGAAQLSLEAALRGGAGYVGYLNEAGLCEVMLMKYPETIYHKVSLSDTAGVLEVAKGYTSVLVGPGLGCSEEVARLVEALITSEGGVLIIDADGLNSISKYSSCNVFSARRREIIITPHPLELSRLSGIEVADINSERVKIVAELSERWGVTLLLKGEGTVVSDGKRVYVNTSGNPALAKAGSGDVLSGLIASLSAFMQDKTLSAILSAFIHGLAAERESSTLSTFGVLPSELPRRIAEVLCRLEKSQKM